jgi:hypothetical protein
VSDSSKAVFLSYASQDAEAARRICEVLRAAGLEVWFDQSELRGGDAWDASIRRQIKECALFLPVISANTESRTEGYFRLEWRLAEQRSHLMAKGRPFLVPVVIDATSDAQAHVPDAFLEVQWSRLPEGRCDEKFAARVRQLLSGEAIRSRGAGAAAQTVAGRSGRKRFPRWLIWVVVAAVIAALKISGTWFTRQATPSPARAAAAPGPAAELVAKARALLDDDPLMTRRNVELAEQLSLDAIAKDQAGAEAFAVAAWANFRFLNENYDDTSKRRADLRSYAEKARLLDPDSINAELAMSGVLVATRNRDEAIKRLTILADRAPGNLTVLRMLAQLLTWGPLDRRSAEKDDREGVLARLRALSPLGRSYADTYLAGRHWTSGEYLESGRLLDGVFASGLPVRLSYLIRLLVLTYGWGDLAAARDFVATTPSKLLLEDAFITHVSNLWLWSGDYEQALQTLNRTQREVLRESRIEVPTALLRGNVHAAAGRPGSAAIQWREALKTVERLLQEKPDSLRLHEAKELLLAKLGDRKAAAAQHALVLEMRKEVAGSIDWAGGYDYQYLTGDIGGAVARLDRLIARDNGRWATAYNNLRFDPSYRTLRNDPRVKAILERGARWLAEMKAGSHLPNSPFVE